MSDGAAACLLMSEKMVKELNVKPLARIVGFADSALSPIGNIFYFFFELKLINEILYFFILK